MEAAKCAAYYHHGGKKMIISFGKDLEQTKKDVLAYQLVPNSFYDQYFPDSIVNRVEPNYVTIENSMTQEVLAGADQDIKITTLGVLGISQAEKIPDGHIYLFYGGSETQQELTEKLEMKDESLIFHIDKREFEHMVSTIFSTDTGYELSRLKAEKLKCVMESRFYNTLRENLEKDLTGMISSVVLSELGSTFIDDKMFEDTQKSLLPYYLQKFHQDETHKLSFMTHNNKDDLIAAVNKMDAKAKKIQGDPPVFFTEEWAKSMIETVQRHIAQADGSSIKAEPVSYSKPIIHTGDGIRHGIGNEEEVGSRPSF